MPLPAGITTCTVTIGPEIRILGSGAVISGAISADRRLVWAATGATIYNLPEEIPTTSPGGSVSFQVPHVDQPGFTDPNGGAITNWAYTFVGQVRFEGSQSVPVRKSFQVFVGQTEVDLDLVPEGPTLPAVVAPSSADRALEAAAEAEQSALDAEDSAIQAAASAAAASGAAAAQAAAEAAQAGAETARAAAETARAAAEAARDGSVDAETAAETAQAAAETASASATSAQAAAETARDAALAAQTGAESAQAAAAGSATAAATSESNTTNAISNRFGVTQPVLATNWIVDPDMAVSNRWTAPGGQVLGSDGTGRYLRLTAGFSGSSNIAIPAAGTYMTVVPGTVVMARILIRGVGASIGKSVLVRLWNFSAGVAQTAVTAATVILTGSWQEVVVTGTMPSPADTARLYLYATGFATTDQVDIGKAYLGPVVGEWFSGASAGARWTGAVNASTSELVQARSADSIDARVGVRAVGTVPVATATGWRASTALHFDGTGSPEGVVTAPVGARYVDTAATNGAVEWIKAIGAGNTGWRVVYGDTGWRTVTSLLANGWTSSEVFRLRRVGADVTLHGVFVKTNATSDTFGVPPTGFRPGQATEAFYATAGVGSGGGAALFETKLAHWKLYRTGFTTTAFLTVTYPTDDAWPATLPGTTA